MKFGLHLDNGSNPNVDTLLAEWREMVVLADESGFDSVSVVDHMVPFPNFRDRALPLLDPWQLLSTFAVLTKRVTLFTLVSNGSLRHPVDLAKQSASLDALSRGRMKLGLGAGGYDLDEKIRSSALLSGEERYARLEECIELVGELWRGEATTYDGKFYQIDKLVSAPSPKRSPGILVAGKSRRLLSIAARKADAINFAFSAEPELTELVSNLATALRDQGRGLESFDITLLDRIFLSESAWQRSGSPVVNGHPGLVGSAPELIDKIKRLEERGADALLCMFPNLATVRAFAEEVLPEFS